MARATLKEVAKLAGVSIARVSRVLNGAADQVKPGAREAVITASEKLGSRLDRAARRLLTRVFGRSKPHLAETVFSLYQDLYQDGWGLSDALVNQLKSHQYLLLSVTRRHSMKSLVNAQLGLERILMNGARDVGF